MANPKTFNTQLSEEQLNTAFDNAINKVPELRAALDEKVDKQDGKGLSTNDYTDEEKAKLSGLENYDDTELKAEIAAAAEQAAINRSTLGYQRKNLLKNSNFTERNTNGVVITDNSDGTYSLSGTPTATADYFYTAPNNYSNMYDLERGKTYTISSGSNKILIRIDRSSDESSWKEAVVENIAGSATFTVPDDTSGLYIRFRSAISAGNLSGVILKPMIRYAEITDDTYEPYKPSVEERLAALEAILGGGT